MELSINFFDLIIHLDDHLNEIISIFGLWTYLILFLIIFCETGLVVAPFLPGDSMLFIVGALSTDGILKIEYIVALLVSSAILGNTVNYHIGRIVAPKVFLRENNRFLKQKHLERTQRFFAKYGGKTIIIARFIPFVRTLAPFLAGIGKMPYWSFQKYNIIGSGLWVMLFSLGGYFFGKLPAVENNFTLVIAVITLVSVLPGAASILIDRYQKKQPAK